MEDDLMNEIFFGYCSDDNESDGNDGNDGSDGNYGDENKERKEDKEEKNNKSNKIIYENKELYSQEGILIGYIPERRYKWYIKKGLCTVINETAIALNFKPNYKNDKFGIDKEKHAPKKNVCVVCGSTENLKRFRVVPYEIKKLLPENNKAHVSSDVVVLCESKCSDGDYYNKELKLKLFKDHNIDVNNFKIDSKKRTIYTVIQKIAKDDYKCSNPYTAKMLENYFGKDCKKEDMEKLVKEVETFTYMGYKTPEEMLVGKIIESGKIKEFINLWKQNFCDNMNPTRLEWDFWSSDQCF